MVPFLGLAAVTIVGLLVLGVLAARALVELRRLEVQVERTRAELGPAYRAYHARTRDARAQGP
ncbi:hypothetical protein [Nocardiopsis composta]|uniref:Protein-S-isoprenylcysteine O-methyltransferase Ste14 n=1 Tax=Nocardiopsis composta TaxID=157465 RepID=A0A7W8QUP7_9ACTN|nr:hypothetical protein [Nocardiopsis composta]MBB5435996.1 protein-S-isoprenylcysteine O-methyltransferase Ste14 [Nocardiopsis composta]